MLSGFGCLALVYIWVIPPSLGPDEMAHSQTVRLLAEEHRMPVASSVTTDDRGAHAMHPPLYYALQVPLYYLFRGEDGAKAVTPRCIRAMRFLSLLLGGVALWQFYAFLGGLFPRQPIVRLSML
ncbi:MAG: hypothetical protein ACUVX8_14910, partial [Candidatus Zipacnadales bacterium]